MSQREECLFDPLSGGLFDNDGDSNHTSESSFPAFARVPTESGKQQKSQSLFDDEEEADEAPPEAPTPVEQGTKAKNGDEASLLAKVDLSKISVVHKIDRLSEKKKKKAKEKAAIKVVKLKKNSGLLGGGDDDDDDDFDLKLKPKVEQDTLENFLLRGDDDKKTKEKPAPGLFDSDGSDDEKEVKDSAGNSAYMKRLLTEDKPDEFDTDISDLGVAKMLTTDSDTAGGLIESEEAAKNIRASTSLAEKTSDDLLKVADDDEDLAELMNATQISTTISDSADGTVDLFSVDKNDNEIDDDLFSMIDTGGNSVESGTAGSTLDVGDDLSSIDAYISAQAGGSGSLFD